MADRINDIQARVSSILNALGGVFSTPQWGGRAYKLPGPGGSRSKPRLLAHVTTSREGDAVTVSFKLEKARAVEVVERYGWIEPHSFRTLAPAGWVTARVSTRRQVMTLAKLLSESRALYGAAEPEPDPEPGRSGTADPVVGRIDRVMQAARAEGWSPPADDDFA